MGKLPSEFALDSLPFLFPCSVTRCPSPLLSSGIWGADTDEGDILPNVVSDGCQVNNNVRFITRALMARTGNRCLTRLPPH